VPTEEVGVGAVGLNPGVVLLDEVSSLVDALGTARGDTEADRASEGCTEEVASREPIRHVSLSAAAWVGVTCQDGRSSTLNVGRPLPAAATLSAVAERAQRETGREAMVRW